MINWFALIIAILNILLGMLFLYWTSSEEKYTDPNHNLIGSILGFIVLSGGVYLACYALGWVVNP